jgi:23S rRNA pseudouridine2604 synthase
MAQSGMASRREAKDLIRSGKVTVNGKKIREPGFGIIAGKDIIETKESKQQKEAILFYKPRGIETSKTSPESKDIHDKFPQFAHLAPVGRLDKDSEGLIILSNDGVLAKMITGENSHIEKEYKVTVREDVMPIVLSKMEKGILIEGSSTLPCVTKKLSRNEYSITLREGRKHQVRRMANACSLTVTRLVRIRIGDLTIGKMTAGNFKIIPNNLINEMKK